MNSEFRALLIIILSWMVFVLASMAWDIYTDIEHSQELGINAATTHFNRDKALRLWASTHGGFYVPTNERTPPNPNLSHIEERDIITPSGKKLTLMNPAYMVRQMSDEFPKLYGVTGRIVSRAPLNPNNAADPWETRALEQFDHGEESALEFVDYQEVPHLRYFRPLMIVESCLKCHSHQGYKIGDVRGGVGVAVNMSPYLKERNLAIQTAIVTHLAIFLFGLFLLYFAWKIRKDWAMGLVQQSLKLDRQGNELRKAQRIAKIGHWYLDLKTNQLDWSDEVYRIFELDKETFAATYEAFLETIHPDDRDLVNEAYTHSLTSKQPYEITHRIQLKDKSIKYVNEACETNYDSQGTPINSLGTVQDITEKVRIQENLKQSELLFRTLTTVSPVGIYQTDQEGNCSFVNQKWSEIAGMELEKALGRGWMKAIHPEDRAMVFELWDQSIREQKPFQAEYRFKTKMGKVTWVMGQFISILDQNQKLQGYVGTVTDITDAKSREKELSLAKENAELASNAKSQFLANMNHELRTPLNGVLGLSQILLEEVASDPDKKEMVEVILSSGYSLLHILNDVLELSRIETKRIHIVKVPFSPKDLSEKLSSLFTSASKKKQLSLDRILDSKVSGSLIGDPFAIEQVLSHLIGNAIKFRSERPLQITVRSQRVRNEWRIGVKDNGIGVSEEDATRIFGMFERAGSSEDQPGNGMGLAICKRIVQNHGGKIWVRSSPGSGSVFIFSVMQPDDSAEELAD